MLIRHHMEGIFFIRDKAGHFISALLKENSKKEPRLFSEFFFIILTAKSPDTSSHPKTAETPGQHVRRVVFSFMKTILNQADEHGRDIVCIELFPRLNVQRLMKIKRLQRSEHFRDDVRHSRTLSQKMNERQAIRQCGKETDERGFRFFHGAIGRLSFYRQ